MLKVAQQVLTGLFLIVTAVELESQHNGLKGAEKKAAAVAKFHETLDPHLPDWLNPILTGVLGMLIDGLVAWASKSGFFGQLSAG